ncbi:MAG: hypothetical protein JW904_14275 [Spirochaetales bacterium]|nr:hypothetical protein [Spirochaetales bacterium]
MYQLSNNSHEPEQAKIKDGDGGEKIFLLAQSYMPAQEIQIVINPGSDSLSPWYSADFGPILDTPEWRFYPATDLRKF